MAKERKKTNRILVLTLALLMVGSIFSMSNAFAAHKVIGLVSESEYYANYTDTSKYTATPYYRYASRSKETATSGSSTMSGWTYESKKQISKSTGRWQMTAISASTKSDGSAETVVTVETKTAKKYYTWVCNCNKWYWKNNGGKCGSCGSYTKNYLSVYLAGKISATYDSSDGSYECPKSISRSDRGGSTIGTVLNMYYNNNSIDTWTSASAKNCSYLWDNKSTATFYRATTTKYQYTFSRWTDWGSWSDWTPTRKTTSDSLKEDTEVKYYIVDIEPDTQTISGTSSYSYKTGDSSFRLDCTTNGTGTLSYTSNNPDVASVDSQGNVSIGNAGTAKITVSASGNSDYYPASKTVTVKIAQRVMKSQTISGKSSYSLEYGASDFSLGCSTSGDGELTYSCSNSSVASVSGSGRVTIGGVGNATITVEAAGTLDYYPASKNINITVEKKAQTISGKESYTVTYGCDVISLNCSTNGDGNLSYTSSKPSVFQVDNTGNVSVLGSGTAKITVNASSTSNCKSAKKTITITSKIAPVTQVEAELKDNDTLTISWSKTDCDEYKIKYSKGNKNNWVTLKAEGKEDDVDTENMTAEIDLDEANISRGSKYYITVVGVCKQSTSSSYKTSDVSATDSFRRVAKVTKVKAVRLNKKKVKISWKKTASADGYNIYRLKSGEKAESREDWDLYKTTTNSYFIDTKAKKGNTYTYWVEAYQNGGEDGVIKGDWSKAKKI